jgi:hypothetical protein
MPTSDTRHRIEIPLDLYQAINQAAADAALPTSALATMWLLYMLRLRRPDLHVRDPYRSGIEQFERRLRRPGELPDDRSLSAILRPPEDSALGDAPADVPTVPHLTTVRLPTQEGGILSLTDEPATQS